MSKILKILKFLVLIIFVTSHNLPEYMEHGFICPDTEDMEPTSSGSFQKGNNPFSVQVWLPNGRKCYFSWETLARIVVSHPWRKIMGFSFQARKGPDFKKRIGVMIKITDATTHCDEPGAITHKSYQPRSEVQVQWARLGAELTDKLMFRVIILDEYNWYGVNITLQNCHLEKECASSPCKNNGTCLDGLAFYTCECPPGFTGYNCEKDINECENNYCKNNATCHNSVGSYTCTCSRGWEGKHCDQNIDECESNYCKNNATCQDTIGSYNCTCSHGWQGKHCDQNINECLTNNPCSDHGICQDLFGGYKCVCLQGWTGPHCEIDIDECESNPCRNKATCNNTLGSYKCSCAAGWQGPFCEFDVDECKQKPCGPNGHYCINTDGSYVCKCNYGWKGQNCTENVSCPYSLCQNLGTCNAETGKCQCFPQWTGVLCENLIKGFGTCDYALNHGVDASFHPYKMESDVKTKEACCFFCLSDKRRGCASFLWEKEQCKLYDSTVNKEEHANAVVGSVNRH